MDLAAQQFACTTDADCAAAHVCLNGVCAPPGAADAGDGGVDAGADGGSDGGVDAGADGGSDGGVDAGCTCTGLVSAYRFADPGSLGHDFVGNNHMTTVGGTPQQSTTTPGGFGGYSLQLDGSSTVCIAGGFTFDSTADHTLCWWARPAALANQTNQFAQNCGYDTWTTNSGTAYRWHINNCNGGVGADLDVPGVYAVGSWVQICQTYTRASLRRTVVLDGQTGAKVSVTDTAPILMDPAARWCIGSYSGGGFWTGLIYRPLWFDRVLSDTELQQVSANGCCLP